LAWSEPHKVMPPVPSKRCGSGSSTLVNWATFSIFSI
jgi:hypothetical protein